MFQRKFLVAYNNVHPFVRIDPATGIAVVRTEECSRIIVTKVKNVIYLTWPIYRESSSLFNLSFLDFIFLTML